MIDYLNSPVQWNLFFETVFLLEVEKVKVSSFLPDHIQPFEIRPNICLMGIGLQKFKPDNLNFPEFDELYWFLNVTPHLKAGAPVPKFASYVGNVASDCNDFLTYANERDKMFIYRSDSINIAIDAQNYVFSAEDSHGKILELHASKEAKQKKFYKETLWGQQISAQENNTYFGIWKWEGLLYEFQKSAAVGRLYNHPFFRGLEVDNIALHCHTQMLTPPVTQDNASLTFYQPTLLKSS